MNPIPKVKRNRGSVAITLTQNQLDSLTEQDMLDLFEGLKTRTAVVNVKDITWERFNQLKRRLVTGKRRGYLIGYHFDLEETANDNICGTITFEYTKVTI